MCASLVISVVANLFVLVARPGSPSPEDCGSLVSFALGSRFQNCDSGGFNAFAIQPEALLTEGALWQSRPAYIIYGFSLNIFLRAISFGMLDPFAAQPPHYVEAEYPFIALNLLVIAATMAIFWLLAGKSPRGFWGVIVLGSLVILLNPLTRAFAWTAHLQLFNLLAPALAIGGMVWVLSGRKSNKIVAAVALALGIGMLAYGYFLITVIGLLIGLLVNRQVREAILFAVLSFIPIFVYVLTVRLLVGSFYSHETEAYRQFVWVVDALRQGTLEERLTEASQQFTLSFGTPETLLALGMMSSIIVFWVCASMVNSRSQILKVHASSSPTQEQLGGGRAGSLSSRGTLACLILIPIQTIFYFGMGFYANRLTWSLVVTIAFLMLFTAQRLAPVLNSNIRILSDAICMVMAVSWIAVLFSTSGSWS